MTSVATSWRMLWGGNNSQEPSKSLIPNIGSKEKSPCGWVSGINYLLGISLPMWSNFYTLALKEKLRCFKRDSTMSYSSDSIISSINSNPQEWDLIPWQAIWDPYSCDNFPHRARFLRCSTHWGALRRTWKHLLALQTAQWLGGGGHSEGTGTNPEFLMENTISWGIKANDLEVLCWKPLTICKL